MEFLRRFRLIMNYKLVAKKIEVNPMVTTPSFFTVKDIPVKGPALIKVMNGYGDVEW
jgi:hypothetical protein